MSSSYSDVRELPPAPNVPAPKIPSAPKKGEEYVSLNGDHASYKSPPGSGYTTLDSKSSSGLHGVKVLPDQLQLKVRSSNFNDISESESECVSFL